MWMSEHQFNKAPEGGLAYILRKGDRAYPLHILMLHGLSGDERDMWVLESVLPSKAPIASLRGRFPMNENGYQWTDQRASIENQVDDFSDAIRAVKATLQALSEQHEFDHDRLVLMGFSQGAALSFALAEMLAQRPKAIVVLAGFYPRGMLDPISDIPIFWGHGINDAHVPVSRARQDVAILESKGASVRYCEADVGHKLGIECTRGLKRWLSNLDNAPGS
jgi:phospholipase/carboxylesterase